MHYVATKICRTSEIGINGNLFGGTMLSWLDEAGAAFAGYISRTQSLVTLKMEEVLFRRPVKISHHVRIYASVHRLGTTSLTIDVEARRFDFDQDSEELVCSTRMVFVKIDDLGNPIPIDSQLRASIDQSLADFARPR
ncbi:hotdog domain-containing protein [Desulfobulbus sp.]|uniref:acyl-CoA thioesterase n=1 Tax=Desulfobulbus sp. TaxID=895 RepID=UPI00286F3EE9|nr:hotdog domain-containing protein [Desulfobulbus sp.]